MESCKYTSSMIAQPLESVKKREFSDLLMTIDISSNPIQITPISSLRTYDNIVQEQTPTFRREQIDIQFTDVSKKEVWDAPFRPTSDKDNLFLRIAQCSRFLDHVDYVERHIAAIVRNIDKNLFIKSDEEVSTLRGVGDVSTISLYNEKLNRAFVTHNLASSHPFNNNSCYVANINQYRLFSEIVNTLPEDS